MEAKRKKVGLFTLGITLILVGTAILLNRYTDYAVLKDLYLMWPAFLILLGLEFIATKIYYDVRKQDIQLSPSGISIFLVIILLFTSVLWSGINTNAFPFGFNINSNWGAWNFAHQVRETLEPDEISLADAMNIEIKNVRGIVDIQPWDEHTLKVTAEVIVDTNNIERASELMGDILRISGGNRASVTVRNPYSALSNEHQLNAVNLTLWVPRSLSVIVETSFGEIYAADLHADITARNAHSRVDLTNITGNVQVNNRHGRVSVKTVIGNASIVNAHGEVLVEDIFGMLKIENEHNSTTARTIEKDVDIRSRHGQVRLENVSGNARVENEHNSTNIDNITGNLTVISRHGAVNLSNISGDIDVKNEHNSIRLTNDHYDNTDIAVETAYNSIHADSKIGLIIHKETNTQDGSVINGNGRQKIRLKNRHGEIRIDIR